MNEIVIAVLTLLAVCLITSLLLCYTKYKKKQHKQGVIIIPVNNDSENVDYAVKSSYFEECFDNTTSGREILIVDFGCSPQVWEHYVRLASQYSTVHTINSYELVAYIKVKYIKKYDYINQKGP
ncbi:MAG: hypothetical protein E7509_01185 [Ruminococcus sp.]|nr:hypothetical protein [Ruminococcus sp.]